METFASYDLLRKYVLFLCAILSFIRQVQIFRESRVRIAASPPDRLSKIGDFLYKTEARNSAV